MAQRVIRFDRAGDLEKAWSASREIENGTGAD
jgi:hypothetical protein